MPVRHRRQVVALQHERRFLRIRIALELGACLLQHRAVAEHDIAGQLISPLGERRIQMKHFAGGRGFVRVVRFLGAAGKIARRPVCRNFTRIDFMRKVTIHQIFGPRRRSDRRVGRIDTGNAGDEPVRMR